MESVVKSIDGQVVLVIGAIIVAVLLLRLLLRLLNAGLGTFLTIVAIVVVLQYFFGISPKHLWFEISRLPQDLVRFVQGFS